MGKRERGQRKAMVIESGRKTREIGRNGEEWRKASGRGSASLDDEETVQVCLHALGLDM